MLCSTSRRGGRVSAGTASGAAAGAAAGRRSVAAGGAAAGRSAAAGRFMSNSTLLHHTWLEHGTESKQDTKHANAAPYRT